ncbi:MAG: ribonuclease HII [Devosia sp.]|uniref:ribonuclease HII n=1 Tax=Devosia sp. TaxID=1871048 RepID=UPI001AC541B4|nr:ribonuclease HII [Devosia sp.]MBN9311283.1 ribonuclease HII [Devosia sp.]MBN9317418.1 ribonuclease HII [Devosia sp.]
MPTESQTPPIVPALPTLKFERAAIKRGATIVCGVDEAGRGPLAGPVVVSAVVLNHRRVPSGLNDSKQLTAAEREELYEEIMAKAIVSITVMPPSVIARMNILQASLWGMGQAVRGLTVKADHVLVDGHMVPKNLPCAGQAIIGGDGKSVSIAAASIVAKVTRDRMCQIMHCEEPHFGFDSHKGYAAPMHLAALTEHGPGRHHRMDFAPCIEAQRLKDAGIVVPIEVAAA